MVERVEVFNLSASHSICNESLIDVFKSRKNSTQTRLSSNLNETAFHLLENSPRKRFSRESNCELDVMKI